MTRAPYTQEVEDDIFEIIENAVLASAPTPSTNYMARETGHSKGHVERAVSVLARDGRITARKAGQRKIYSIPGEQGETTPSPGGGGAFGNAAPFDYEAANAKMVAALGAYFRRRAAAP